MYSLRFSPHCWIKQNNLLILVQSRKWISLYILTLQTVVPEWEWEGPDRPPRASSYVRCHPSLSFEWFPTCRCWDSFMFPCSSNRQSKAKGTWGLNLWIKFALYQHMLPRHQDETYWLVNPKNVSIVWQRFIRTEVSHGLGFHPGTLLPFEHAEVSAGGQGQNYSLGKEREILSSPN